MKTGIFHVKFSSPQDNWGEGLAVFDHGKVNGGDHGYLYLGSYKMSDNKIEAALKVVRWNQSIEAIFGNIPEFDLKVIGTYSDGNDSFEVSGLVVQQPQMKITISGTKLSELA